MAFMIPERIPGDAPEAERQAFDLLRRDLPEQCAVWHRSALELETERCVPFLALGCEIGIVPIVVLDWQPGVNTGRLTQWWPGARRTDLSAEQELELKSAQQTVEAFLQLLIAARLPVLMGSHGELQPATHRVYLLNQYHSREVNRSGLRGMLEGVLVLAGDEVEQMFDILRQHTPPDRQLSRLAFDAVRLIVSPSVQISLPSARSSLAVRSPAQHRADVLTRQARLPLTLDVYQEQVVKSYVHLPAEHQQLSRDLDARLIRGVVGSGKSLILLHRARFLSQYYPQWRILVLTYNKLLASYLEERYNELLALASSGSDNSVTIIHFHAWCREMLKAAGLWRASVLNESSQRGLIVRLLKEIGRQDLEPEAEYLRTELEWIRDQGYIKSEDYASAPRTGRQRRMIGTQRDVVWQLLQAYREQMRRDNQLDWPEVPLLVLEGMDRRLIATEQYDAILIDEAQDFAPAWFKVVRCSLRSHTNMLFLVADAAQKIYRRSFSWRALQIDVTGNRSQILRRNYRNTYEILTLAYELVRDDQLLCQELQDEGETVISPDLDGNYMRHGPEPIVLGFDDPERELEYIAQEIVSLRAAGYNYRDIAVMAYEKKTLDRMAVFLQQRDLPCQQLSGVAPELYGNSVRLLTLHGSKGVEFSVVFVTGVERLQPLPGLGSEELTWAIADRRRVLYVAMTRARDRLYVSYSGQLPDWLQPVFAAAVQPAPI